MATYSLLKTFKILFFVLSSVQAIAQWHTELVDDSGNALAIYPSSNGMIYYIHQNLGYSYEDYFNEASIKYFDGYETHTIAKLPIKLQNEFPVKLEALNKHELLLGFFNDASKTPFTFNTKNNQFSRPPTDSSFLASSVFQIKESCIYFSVNENSESVIYKYENGVSSALFKTDGKTVQILEFKNHIFLSKTDGSFIAFDMKGNLIKRFKTSDFKDQKEHFTDNSLLYNNFTISTGRLSINFPELKPSLQVFDDKDFTFSSDSRFEFKGNVFFDKKDNVLFSHPKSLNSCQSHTTAFIKATGLECFSSGLESNMESVISNDFSKTTWFSTGTGLYKLYRNPEFITTALKGNSLRNIFPLNEHELVIGTEHNGTFKINRKNNEVSHFSPSSNAPGPLSAIRQIFIDSNNELWIGSLTGSLKRSSSENKYIFFKNLKSRFFAELKPNTYLLQDNFFNLSIINLADGKHENVETKIPLDAIHEFEELDAHKILLIGDSYSLIYNKISNDLSVLKGADKANFDVHTDGENKVWLAKRSGLLTKNVWDGKQLNIEKTFKIEKPIATITETNDSTLWLGTFNGLANFNKNRGTITYVDNSLLSHPECNRKSAYFDEKFNRLYIGSIDGLSILKLNQYNQTIKPFEIRISALSHSVKGSNEHKNEYVVGIENYNINLPSTERYCKLNFTTNSATEKANFQYYYRINEGNWIDNGSSNEILHTYIPSGTYKYEIYAVDSFNQRSINTLTINIKVAYFFYQTWWFITLLFITSISIFYWWFRRLKNEKTLLENTVHQRTKELQKDKEIIENQANKLRELVEVKNRFFANISHELRTPLTLILSPLNHILKQQDLPIKTQRHLELMNENGKLLKERISEMLELSRLSSGKVTLSKQAVYLPELISKNCRIFIPMAADKNIHLEFKIEVPEAYVLIDEKRFGKIVQNLLGNALKFTNKNGKVIFSTKMADELLQITVQDNGIGMKEEVQNKIFERFYQVNQEQSQGNPGTGIGLTMVKEYIDLMGGRIDLESKPGIGTKFIVFLKLEFSEHQRLHSDLIETDLQPSQSNKYDHKPRLLVVEDNKSLRRYLSEILESTFKILEAENGKEAIEILEENLDTEIILSDLMMPELDGISLLSFVRKDMRFKILPFLFLTAKHNEHTKLESYKIGVDDYLTKPFDEEELIHRLKAVYSNYQNRLKARETTELNKTEKETNFSKELEFLVEQHLTSHEFSVNLLAEKMGLSPRHFLRKVKEEIGLTPINYITEFRLNAARKLIENQTNYDLKKIASQVGIKDSRYLKKIYFKRFGTKIG